MISPSRRLLLIGAAAALAGCAAGATSPPAATINADALAAAQAITGIVAVLKTVDTSGLSATNITALTGTLAQLQGLAAALSTSTQPADVANAATQVNSILSDVTAFLPAVTALLPLLTLVESGHGSLYEEVWVTSEPDLSNFYLISDMPKAVLTDAQVAALKAKIAALAAAAAAAKAKAQAKPAF